MKKIFLLLPLFFVGGCLEKEGENPKSCFKIVDSEYVNGSIMLDSCKGEAWILLRTVSKEATENSPEMYTYSWHKMERHDTPTSIQNL